VLFVGGVLVIAVMAFVQTTLAGPMVLVPLVCWASFRDPRTGTSVALGVGAVAVLMTALDVGPYARVLAGPIEAHEHAILLVQAFILSTTTLAGFVNAVECERREFQRELLETQRTLEERIATATAELRVKATALEERTSQLTELNAELGSFSYTVAHDLRGPLRAIIGFTHTVLEESAVLDQTSRRLLARVELAASRMNNLLSDLLILSRVSDQPLNLTHVDLSGMARRILSSFQELEPGRRVTIQVEDGLSAWGDAALLTIAMDNLLGNAWKYTSKTSSATISFTRTRARGVDAFVIRDDGTGFDMKYVTAIFRQLHSPSEFEGSGVGLATVARVLRRHGGSIWAEGIPGKGAAFFFTLPGEPVPLKLLVERASLDPQPDG
jgi:signal transduction histidine kinase